MCTSTLKTAVTEAATAHSLQLLEKKKIVHELVETIIQASILTLWDYVRF